METFERLLSCMWLGCPVTSRVTALARLYYGSLNRPECQPSTREYSTLHLSVCSIISMTLAAVVDLPLRYSEHCVSPPVHSLP